MPGAPASAQLHDDVFASLLSLLEPGRCARRPLLALNGPVGAGKSTLVRALAERAAAHGLRLAVASIDDLYHPLPERLERLAGNPFGVSRVPPGSHDVRLLLERLSAWRAGGALRLPRFDKRLAGGEGDRSGEQRLEADALVLEGWLMGCRPLGEERLAEMLPGCCSTWPLNPQERRWLPRWDRELSAYQPLWEACDGLWLLRPQRWTLPRRWRFQAEARQRREGGGSLSGAALERLVRASLHSLPPPLYMDPLLGQLAQTTSGPQRPEPAGPELGSATATSPSRPGLADPRLRRHHPNRAGEAADHAAGAADARIGASALGGAPEGVMSDDVPSFGAAIPLVGVHVLDSRRRPLNPADQGPQSSLSSASSAIG